MKEIPPIIKAFQEQIRVNPDYDPFRFVDYDDDAQRWIVESHTYREAYNRSLEIAYMLRKKGIRPGDRAIIFSMQDFGTMCAVYGCMMAGVVFVIIPPPLDEDKTARFISVLKSCQPKALISNYALEQGSDVNLTGRLLKEAFRDTIRLKRIYTDKLVPYRREDVIVPVDMEDLAYMQYTSGSTKDPKGVRVLWRNVTKNLEQCMSCLSLDHVSIATWVPFFHNLGLTVTVLMAPMVTKPVGYYLQTLRFLENPKLWVKMMYDFKTTLTVGPGSAYDACTRIFSEEEAAKYPLTHVTHFMNGSEFISAKTVERFTKMFRCAPNAMAPGYGVSENVCLATFASQDYRTLKLDYEAYQKNRAVIIGAEDSDTDASSGGDANRIKEIVSVGAPVKDLTVLIGNAKTHRVYPDLRIGEIFLGGTSVTDGYWQNPKDSRCFHSRLGGYDMEFYRTGDLGFLYEGHLYITGRIKEMIIVNGHNIYPSDLQVTIAQGVPALAGAAYGFFSVASDTKEQVIAVVESRPEENFALRIQEINKAVSDRFSFSFYDVVFVPRDTIPRTDNRKLQMLKARTLYLEGKLPVLYSSRSYYMKKQNSTLLGRSIGKAETIIGKSYDIADNIIGKSIDTADTLIDKSMDVTDEIFIQVRSAFQKVLKIDQFSPTESFLALGGDSLMGFELINNIEEKFHIKLDLRELLRDSSVAGITRYIHSVLSGASGRTKAINLKKECRLDDSIRFDAAYTKAPAACRKIFLTGGTGFLGAQLIHAIFRYYHHNGLRIFCLVRADSEAAGMERLKKNLKHYRLWNDGMEHFLQPVVGNLSEPKLGLDADTWNTLAEEVEVIYHSGAILNFIFPYEYLKTTNVDGTAETLRLAGEGRAKYYHYVSSYSVFDTPGNRGKRLREDDIPENWRGFSLSYSETKWVSEHLVDLARKRGLKAAIYRPGDITGAANGIYELNDMVSRIMVSAIQMEGMPLAKYQFHMTPVDYVAKALAYISLKEECFGHAFNLINPKGQSLLSVMNCIRSCGYRIRYIPFIVWKNRIRQSDASQNAMVLLECLFETATETNTNLLWHFFGKDSVYETGNTDLLLGQSGIRCPEVGRKMIAAYLAYFRSKNYIQ
ncbi:MAG: thioester reductase domain-containing protein [Clostridiales bacterium]|nr:thioester reductase domain-containing protein [Clostridiales bacterium]